MTIISLRLKKSEKTDRFSQYITKNIDTCSNKASANGDVQIVKESQNGTDSDKS